RDGDVGLDGHRDHRRGRAAPDRVGDERVAVEALALQRHEQVAGGDRAAVRGDAGDGDRFAEHASAGRLGGFEERHHRASRAALATSASLNGWRTPAISWYVSCPLPASSTTSPATAWWMASKIATWRSAIESARPTGMPC